MRLRRRAMVTATIALGLLAGVLPADAAKPCHKLCRDEVRACMNAVRGTLECSRLRSAERRTCRRDRRRALRTCRAAKGPIIQACRALPDPTACSSPSGAFIDERVPF